MLSMRGYCPVFSYFRLSEVDLVVRSCIVRRAVIDRVGQLDEAFRPIEWDEANRCCRLRAGGFAAATCGGERLATGLIRPTAFPNEIARPEMTYSELP